MSHTRRTTDRRRRVLYSAHQADHAPATAASRREASRLREARRPPAAYGSRVHRRIRGRWFSLVPVRRRTMWTVSGFIGLAALLLCTAHYAAVAWPAIAYRPEIARPLRLDRPDSFGRWFMVAMLTLTSGASLMIYQLRRYRNDDFQGRYRLWRLVLVVAMLASVNSLVSMIEWGGALLDASFGKRVALTGSDWIRLVVSLGGAVLALRLIAEVRRCRPALTLMVFSALFFAVPEAAKWNVLDVDSLPKWTLTTSASLLGSTALFLALGCYLRTLYREVKEIGDSESIKERLQRVRLRIFQRSEDDEDGSSSRLESESKSKTDDETDNEQQGRWWKRKAKPKAAKNLEEEIEEEEEWYDEDDEVSDPEPEAEDAAPKPKKEKRSWFRRRKAKSNAEQDSDTESVAEEPEIESEAVEPTPKKKKKRRRFSLRLSPPTSNAEQDAEEEEPASTASAEEDKENPKRKRGLGWLRRRKTAEAEAELPEESEHKPVQTKQPSSSKKEAEPEPIDPDDIDWSALSKSERRRLRKQLKRQNRAA